MRKRAFAVCLSVMLAFTLMPAAAFAIDGQEGFYPDADTYYIGQSKTGTIKAGSKEVYCVDTTSLDEKSCNVLITNTSTSEAAKLTFRIVDAEGRSKTEISEESACYGGVGSLKGAKPVIEIESDHWNDSFFNISTGDFIVLEAGSSDVDFELSTQIIYKPPMAGCGDYHTNSFSNRAHLIPLYLEDYPKKETVFIENQSDSKVMHFIISEGELVDDDNGNSWGLLKPEYWENRGVTFDLSKDYYLLIFPTSCRAEYSYDDDDYNDDYNYDDDDDWDDDDDDWDDDDYYDDDDDWDDDDDYDYDDDEDDWDYAVAISPQDLKYYTVKAKDKTYNGKAQKSKPVLDYGDILLGTGMYSVTYSNNKKVGTAKMTIKGVDPNSGTITKTFRINPKGTSLSKLSAARKAVTVKWKKQAARMSKSRISGYQIQYSTSSKFSNAKIRTVKGYRNTSKRISSLKAKKKYYVRIRTYMKVGSKKYYSSWSRKKSIKTR